MAASQPQAVPPSAPVAPAVPPHSDLRYHCRTRMMSTPCCWRGMPFSARNTAVTRWKEGARAGARGAVETQRWPAEAAAACCRGAWERPWPLELGSGGLSRKGRAGQARAGQDRVGMDQGRPGARCQGSTARLTRLQVRPVLHEDDVSALHHRNLDRRKEVGGALACGGTNPLTARSQPPLVPAAQRCTHLQAAAAGHSTGGRRPRRAGGSPLTSPPTPPPPHPRAPSSDSASCMARPSGEATMMSDW